MRNLSHLTLDTGNLRLSPRAEVADRVVERLKSDLAAGLPLGGTEWRADVRAIGQQAWTFSLLHEDVRIATCVLCDDVASHQTALAAVSRLTEHVPLTIKVPWLCASIDMAGVSTMMLQNPLLAAQVMVEAGNLERCMAWTLLDIHESGSPAGTRPPAADMAEKSHPSRTSDFDAEGSVAADHPETPVIMPDGKVLLPSDGATLGIGPTGLQMYVQLSRMTDREVKMLRRGTLDVAVLSSGATGYLVTRFAPPAGETGTPIVLEAPFHVGLLPAGQRHLPERSAKEFYALPIVFQDEFGHHKGGRLVTLSAQSCESIERIVSRQSVEAARLGWTRRSHDREIAEFERRFPRLDQMMDRVFARAHARTTVH